jgi:hypothetical protein
MAEINRRWERTLRARAKEEREGGGGEEKKSSEIYSVIEPFY